MNNKSDKNSIFTQTNIKSNTKRNTVDYDKTIGDVTQHRHLNRTIMEGIYCGLLSCVISSCVVVYSGPKSEIIQLIPPLDSISRSTIDNIVSTAQMNKTPSNTYQFISHDYVKRLYETPLQKNTSKLD